MQRARDFEMFEMIAVHPPRAALLFALLTACSAKVATSPADGAPTAATPPAIASAPAPRADASIDASTPAIAPAPSASATASTAAPEPAASSAPPAEPPLPNVAIANIGMHIGGGPNDDVTKDPIRRSVSPHFDEFRRCFAHAEDPKKGGNFGVDLRIGRDGGKATVSHPRSALKGKEFRDCVVRTFEAIDFLKPKGGVTTVSYSLRFAPQAR